MGWINQDTKEFPKELPKGKSKSPKRKVKSA